MFTDDSLTGYKGTHCPHEHTYETRKLIGRCEKFEIYQCPDCDYIYLGLGIPLKVVIQGYIAHIRAEAVKERV